MPTRRRGVAFTRAPAPTPVCRGVPGTMIFELPPADLAASASSCAFFALLRRKGGRWRIDGAARHGGTGACEGREGIEEEARHISRGGQ